jgi:hypothetical protein
MDSKDNHWTVGETVTIKRMEKLLKESGSTSYAQYISSRYICIREDSGEQHGILLKVLGKAYGDQIGMVSGQPFCKDDSEELFAGHHYCSYPFPSAKQVQEVLEILRNDKSLLQKFESASMHINPDSTFWINDTTRSMLLMKKLQILSGRDGQISPARDDVNHYRISIVYFTKDTLTW